MGYGVNHGIDVVIRKEVLERQLGDKTFKQFYAELCEFYQLDIGYSTFMNLLDNRTRWLLVYALPISELVNLEVTDLFEIVQVEKKKDFIKTTAPVR